MTALVVLILADFASFAPCRERRWWSHAGSAEVVQGKDRFEQQAIRVIFQKHARSVKGQPL